VPRTNYGIAQNLGAPAIIGIAVVAAISSCVMATSLPASGSNIKASALRISQPVLSVADGQYSSNTWILTGKGKSKKLVEIDYNTGSFVTSESVNSNSDTIAESTTGDLAIGTAAGTRSSVSLYNGSNGAYLSTVEVKGPVQSLAMDSDGTFTYVLERTQPSKTLFVFNDTHTGFPYKVSPKTVSIEPTANGKDIWLLESDGAVEEMSFFPDRIVKRLSAKTHSFSFTLGEDGNALFILTSVGLSSKKEVKILSTGTAAERGSFLVPDDSTSVGIGAGSSLVFVGVSKHVSGEVLLIPI
jgi:hypothetical protein